jgi:hypothetical protein
MNHLRACLTASVFVGVVACAGAALAQTPASQPAEAASSPASVAARAETWTKKEWTAMKSEWAKDREKWTGCRNQADDQKLAGRKSWSFLYQCMTRA